MGFGTAEGLNCLPAPICRGSAVPEPDAAESPADRPRIGSSPAFCRPAGRRLKRWSRINLAVGNAESLPLPDESQDAVTSIIVFHELPPKVRRIVFHECARVLKPGGRLVLVDSLQRGDQPDYDGLLELFPQNYHEPYCRSYTKEDFNALAASFGLTHIRDVKVFVSKVMVFDKPAAA
ncbi:MAG: class I SAM-dependent methyltransferase [Beijerinckiaceae bacterium]